jgi:hypothetical protein
MRTEQIKKLLCVLCLSLSMVLTSAAMAQTETPSILDRVQKVEDPELAELIRVALEKRRDISQEATFEFIRKITQGYVQIKLLDLQIQEVSRKADSQTGPAEMRYELLLAKAELESKLATEMANLRELMGIVPKLPFAEQPIETLNAWISLQPIDGRVYVLEGQKPFAEYWIYRRWKSVGLLSEKETLDYIRGRLNDKESLPVRFRINYKPETKGMAEYLRSKIMTMAKETHSQMDTEARMEPITFAGSGTSTFFLRQGKITTFHPHDVQRPDGGSKPLSSGLVNPNDLEQHVLWRLLKPGNVPLTFRIEYDEASALLAKMVADTAKDVIKRLGITELVKIESVLVEPVPETAFIGQWRSSTRGDFQIIDVQPNGICQVTMGDRLGRPTTPGMLRPGVSVKGTWFLTTKEIMIDIDDKITTPEGTEYAYRGYLDQEGNLIVDRGQILPQGSFHEYGPSRTILKKVGIESDGSWRR